MRSLAKSRIVGMLSFTAVLSGCFSATSTHRSLEVTCTDLPERLCAAYATSSFVIGAFPQEKWWEIFQDAQLNGCIEEALAFHPDIQIAQLRIGVAYEHALEVRAQLLPYVDLFGSYSRQRQSAYDVGIPAFVPLVINQNLWFNTATALIRATYEIDLWGKNRNQYYGELGQLKMQMADDAQSRLLLATTLAHAYFSYQSHLKERELLTCILEKGERIRTLLQQRFSSGMMDEWAVYQSDAEVAKIRGALEHMKGLLALDEHALAALVGNLNGAKSLSLHSVARYKEPVALPCSLPLELIARRPDIVGSLWNIESMSSGVKVAKARFLPNLDLYGAVGNISFLITKFWTANAQSLFGSASSALPLYTGGELTAQLGQAQLKLDLAVEQYNQTILRAVQEVSDAVTHVKTADAQLLQLKRAVDDKRAIVSLSRERVAQGIATQIVMLQAEVEQHREEVLEEQRWFERMSGIVEVMHAIGGGYCGS